MVPHFIVTGDSLWMRMKATTGCGIRDNNSLTGECLMVPTFEIAGTEELSSSEMQAIVGGDGWLQAIGAAWSAGVDAITGLFSSTAPATMSAPMSGSLA
jgi:hypothetical protein